MLSLLLGTNDLEASQRFDDTVLGALGIAPIQKLKLGGGMRMYSAYVRDPAGHKLCLIYRAA